VVAQYGGGGISGSRFNVLQAEEAACAGLHGFGLGLALHNGVCPPYFVTASSEEERARRLPSFSLGSSSPLSS